MFLFLLFQQFNKCVDLPWRMASAKDNLSQEYRNWVRLSILIDRDGRQLCPDALFEKENWPRDWVQLYQKLKPLLSKICWFKNQLPIISPPSGFTDHNDFDLTLFTRIIEVILERNTNHWWRMWEMRGTRNLVDETKNFLVPTLIKHWKDTAAMLENHGFDMSLVDGLKVGDPFLDYLFKDIIISILGR